MAKEWTPPPKRDKGSISHSALDIQKELAYNRGVNDGKADLHNKISAFIQSQREIPQNEISLDLLESLLKLWV